MVAAVERDRLKNSSDYKTKTAAKLLKAIHEIAFNRIPQNPMDNRYRQGHTLGPQYKHWFCDSFGKARFRLFFRFDSSSKIIVYGWVNDEGSLRTRGSSSDAYAVFASMLRGGNPPDNWAKLLEACTKQKSLERLAKIAKSTKE